MRLIKNGNVIEVKATYNPDIKTIKRVMHETGRTRQQIEKHKKLTFGIILNDEKAGDIGHKVVIDDDALKEFILKCKKKDKKSVDKPVKSIAKKVHKSKSNISNSLNAFLG